MPHLPKTLSETTAADVMTSPAVYVAVETPLGEIARLMLHKGISAVPVLDQAGNLTGMVSEGDLIRRGKSEHDPRRSWWLDLFDLRTAHSDGFLAYLQRHGLRAKDVMTSGVISVSDTTPIAEVVQLLEAHCIKRVPVLRKGRLAGIVSRADLLRALIRAAPVQHHKAGTRKREKRLKHASR